MISWLFVGNVPKGRISKRVFQEDKTRQILRKMNISYPLIRIRTCVSEGKKCLFFGKFIVPCFLETPVLIFAFLLYCRRVMKHRTMVAQRQFVYFIVAICRKTLKFFFSYTSQYSCFLLQWFYWKTNFMKILVGFLFRAWYYFFLKTCEMCFRNFISSFK